MKLFIFGFIGCLITYFTCKYIRKRENRHEWSDVIVTWFVSLFSWFGLVIIFVLYFVEVFYNHLETKKVFKNKPPKWM